MVTVATPLLGDADLVRLRRALIGYTVDSVHDLLGAPGRAALDQGDLPGVARALRRVRSPSDRALVTLVELFLLGADVEESRARAALHPLSLDAARVAGLVDTAAGTARARLDVRPYAEATTEPGDVPEPWWVVSDLGADVRPGPLARDHVLGVGAASLSLARATPRTPVGAALDLGTGSGVQALHLARHSRHVTATDVSARALRLAATTAALSGQHWTLRAGSLLTPVRGERFDLVVANPPFVVSGGGGGYDYRDSGLPGDGVSEALLTSLPEVLTEDGCAVLLANWIVPAGAAWTDRVHGWLSGHGCDAWVWQREVAAPDAYVRLWLHDAGEIPGTQRWTQRYDEWLDWFERAGAAGVGMGLVALWRSGTDDPTIVLEDVPQAIEPPIGAELPRWLARQRWLAATPDGRLLDAHLRRTDGLVRTRDDLVDPSGWATIAGRLRQSSGMRWEVEVDEPVAALVAACDGSTSLRVPMAVLAASLGQPVDDVVRAAVPVVRDLVSRGFLLPAGLVAAAATRGNGTS